MSFHAFFGSPFLGAEGSAFPTGNLLLSSQPNATIGRLTKQPEVPMKRREFIVNTSLGLGAALLARNSILNALAETQLPRKYAATDTVTLGKTGIKTSRLAMGTGTVGLWQALQPDCARCRRSVSPAAERIRPRPDASSTPPTLTAAIPTLPPRSSSCRATKSPS